MDILSILEFAMQNEASDLHITVGVPPTIRVDGTLIKMAVDRFMPEDTEAFVNGILSEKQRKMLEDAGEVDCSYSSPGLGHFRVNAYKQRGSYAVAMRVVPYEVPNYKDIGIPQTVIDLSEKKRGLILITGVTGSGKSTTIASIIDQINKTKKAHIITLEDPIEYLHKHNKSIINQRQIGQDTKSYADGLRAALREDPDIVLVGEMRDLETISIAITAAETGHLVLSTLHTQNTSMTIDRIIDVFPPFQQQQIRIQLSNTIQGIVTQQLLRKRNGKGRVPAFEILIANNAIKNLIREGKTHQIDSVLQTSLSMGMQTMDSSLMKLLNKGLISKEDAIAHAIYQNNFRNMVR